MVTQHNLNNVFAIGKIKREFKVVENKVTDLGNSLAETEIKLKKLEEKYDKLMKRLKAAENHIETFLADNIDEDLSNDIEEILNTKDV